jgi:hypothetical protein
MPVGRFFSPLFIKILIFFKKEILSIDIGFTYLEALE